MSGNEFLKRYCYEDGVFNSKLAVFLTGASGRYLRDVLSGKREFLECHFYVIFGHTGVKVY